MASRRTRDLRWTPSASVTGAEELVLSSFAPPREEAAYLLHVGAEIEHALAVQYLYAGYSLGGSHLTDPEQRARAQQWREVMLKIAREEMAHLATVQNLLTTLGSPLTLEREDFPIPSELYPFDFHLQKLTKESLGKYVLAEMPDDQKLHQLGLEDVIAEIRQRLAGAREHEVHRVGYVYKRISELFTPSGANPNPLSAIASSDIQAESLRFQVRPGEWGLGYSDLLIETATDRASAASAIRAIAEQGEGSGIQKGQISSQAIRQSHFSRFLAIYQVFPDGEWQPARNVATDPTTRLASHDRQITHEPARLWAELFNLRYRMLLVFLSHSFCLQAPLQPSERTPRGLVISWAFGEMYNLRSIAEILMELPLNDDDDLRAGPPFEMPYSLAVPFRPHDWWRLHRDLITAAQGYVNALEQHARAEAAGYLRALARADARALHQIAAIVGD